MDLYFKFQMYFITIRNLILYPFPSDCFLMLWWLDWLVWGLSSPRSTIPLPTRVYSITLWYFDRLSCKVLLSFRFWDNIFSSRVYANDIHFVWRNKQDVRFNKISYFISYKEEELWWSKFDGKIIASRIRKCIFFEIHIQCILYTNEETQV